MSAPPVALIGYRGAGKSTAGRSLARRLGWEFIDTDERVEQQARMSVAELFARLGEPHFRRLEHETLAAALAAGERVVSVGGGAVCGEENRRLLAGRAVCIWLRAAPHVLAQRLAADPRSAALRPALTSLPPEEEVRRLLAQRTPHYAALAGAVVDTDERMPDDVLNDLLSCVRRLLPGTTAP